MSVRTSLIGLCCLIALPALGAPPSEKGNVLHLGIRTHFEPDQGNLELKLRQQGHADVQKLRLEVGGLTAGATYHLVVLREGTESDVFPFVADENGEASLKLMHIGHKDVPGKKFPAGLDPLSDVLAMEIRDDPGGATVLSADLSEPDSLRYLVKRRLTNSGVDMDAAGTLFMKEHDAQVLFRLRAVNLGESADYVLGINCTSFAPLTCAYVGSFSTDAGGRLEIKGLPDGAPTPFEITDVALIDDADQVVLSTELP
jgi:hypothetical protein